MYLHEDIKRPASVTNRTVSTFCASYLQNDWILHFGGQRAWSLQILASVFVSGERTMREITVPAVGYERPRGRLEAIMPLSTFASFFCDTNVLNQGVAVLTQRLLAFITLER